LGLFFVNPFAYSQQTKQSFFYGNNLKTSPLEHSKVNPNEIKNM